MPPGEKCLGGLWTIVKTEGRYSTHLSGVLLKQHSGGVRTEIERERNLLLTVNGSKEFVVGVLGQFDV